jgi:2-dehydro-3-deoxyglucarate aldolase/4-hydroxy-2-oxoheptanedioate aldolase
MAGVRERVLAAERVDGAMLFECVASGVAQMMVRAGAAFLLLDMEHSGFGFDMLRAPIHACRGLPIAPMVRVPRGEYHFLARALDVGAHGVMVPMVESAEQARAIAEATRYPPVGRRGAAFTVAHDDFAPGTPAEKVAALNARNLVIAQIETERGLAAVEDIAAIAGIDVLWVGHFDLTNFLGIPGQFDHPSYLGALDRVVAAGRRHGKGLGFMASEPATARMMRARGFNMIAAGTDSAILMAGVRTILTAEG